MANDTDIRQPGLYVLEGAIDPFFGRAVDVLAHDEDGDGVAEFLTRADTGRMVYIEDIEPRFQELVRGNLRGQRDAGFVPANNFQTNALATGSLRTTNLETVPELIAAIPTESMMEGLACVASMGVSASGLAAVEVGTEVKTAMTVARTINTARRGRVVAATLDLAAAAACAREAEIVGGGDEEVADAGTVDDTTETPEGADDTEPTDGESDGGTTANSVASINHWPLATKPDFSSPVRTDQNGRILYKPKGEGAKYVSCGSLNEDSAEIICQTVPANNGIEGNVLIKTPQPLGTAYLFIPMRVNNVEGYQIRNLNDASMVAEAGFRMLIGEDNYAPVTQISGAIFETPGTTASVIFTAVAGGKPVIAQLDYAQWSPSGNNASHTQEERDNMLMDVVGRNVRGTPTSIIDARDSVYAVLVGDKVAFYGTIGEAPEGEEQSIAYPITVDLGGNAVSELMRVDSNRLAVVTDRKEVKYINISGRQVAETVLLPALPVDSAVVGNVVYNLYPGGAFGTGANLMCGTDAEGARAITSFGGKIFLVSEDTVYMFNELQNGECQ